MTIPDPIKRPGKAGKAALWGLQILLSAAFLMAGFAKLSGQPAMVADFQTIGLGQWFRYLTGAIETTGAILLLFPRLASAGAALLACTMAGAVLAHLTKLPGSPVPPLVLGILSAIILWGRIGLLKAWLTQPDREGA
jgi:hypothetical protein